MKNKSIIVITIMLFMAASVSAAGETQHIEEAKSHTELSDINIGDARNVSQSFLSQLSGLLLSVTSSEDTYQPGDTANFDVTAEFNEEETGEFRKVVEFYRCQDSGCDDPSQDEYLTAATDDEFFYAQVGDVVEWSVTYNVPSTEGFYAASAYVYNPDTGNVLTDVPNRKVFEVREDTTTDSDGDGVIDSNDNCPNTYGEGSDGCPIEEVDVSLSETPSFTVEQSSNTVTGTLRIQNTGGADMSDSDIVEMQVRPYGSGPLSFSSSTVDTCDSDYPNNVHKDYSVDGGDSLSISLQNQGSLSDGESYTVYFMTREGCGGDKTEPIYNSYNAGSFTLDDTGTSEDPEVVQVSKPGLEYKDGSVTAEVHFKNEGGDMIDSDIVEMQVRPKGKSPLSFSDTVSVCDDSYPENVHKSFKLSSGESDSTTLSTSAVERGSGEYTVYLLTRSGCGGEKVEPYYNSVRAGTIDTGEGSVSLISSGLPWIVVAAGFLLVLGGALYLW